MKLKQSSKSKKEAIPTEVGLATNPAKKARGASELVEDVESSPKPARTEPKVPDIAWFDQAPKNGNFSEEEGEFSEDDDEDSRLLKQSFCFISLWSNFVIY